MFLYLNLVGAVKIAKEQVYGRQRKLNEKGETFLTNHFQAKILKLAISQ